MFTPIISSSSASMRIERRERVHERHAAAGDDALFDGRARRLQRVLDAVLLLLELDLGGRADLDDGDAAGELGQALLELLLVEVAVGVLDLGLDLVDARLDGVLGTGAVDDRGVVLGDLDGLGAAEARRAPRSRASCRAPRRRPAPPVTMAMSSSMRLRRSPKPGALTATEVNVPRSLLSTSVGSASPSTSSAMISSCLPACMTFSSTGSRSLIELIFWLAMRMYGSDSTASMRSGSVIMYGEM